MYLCKCFCQQFSKGSIRVTRVHIRRRLDKLIGQMSRHVSFFFFIESLKASLATEKRKRGLLLLRALMKMHKFIDINIIISARKDY